MLAALRARGLEPDYVVGHSVGEFTALAATSSLTPSESIALVRERGLAMAEAARISNGSMAAILGLEDEVVEQLCEDDRRRLARELQLPGPDRRLRQAGRRRRGVREGRGARRPPHREAQGLGRVPQPARRARRRPPAAGDRARASSATRLRPSCRRSRRRSSLPSASRSLLVEQLTAPVKFTQAARGLVEEGVKVFVEVGPSNVLSGLVKRIDRTVKTISVNNVAGLHKAEETALRRLSSALSKGERPSSPGARVASAGRSRSSSARPAPRSWSATARARRRRKRSRRRPAAARSRRTSRTRTRRARSSRRPATSTSSSTTRG